MPYFQSKFEREIETEIAGQQGMVLQGVGGFQDSA